MGFSITWIAFKDIPLAEAALALGLATSGQSDELFEFDINGATVGNWSVIVYNDVNESFSKPGRMQSLSTGRDVVVVNIIDSVMLQWAERWQNGKETWNIQHTNEEGPRHLEATGQLPPEYETIRRDRFADQDEDDAGEAQTDYISEIPLEVAQTVTGFRHDETEATFHELVPVSKSGQSPKKSLIDRLLGR